MTMDAIVQVFHAVVQFRYTFIGLAIGWGSAYAYKLLTNASGDDVIIYAAAVCGITGLVLDIRRRSSE